MTRKTETKPEPQLTPADMTDSHLAETMREQVSILNGMIREGVRRGLSIGVDVVVLGNAYSGVSVSKGDRAEMDVPAVTLSIARTL